MKTALTIAGTDPSGGAGIQADIKTMTANGVFATCAVTALVAPEHYRRQEHRGVYAGLSGGGAGLRVHRYLPRRGEDRHGLQHSADPGDRGQAEGVWGQKSGGGPG